MEFDLLRLPNGLRVLHFEDKNILTVHCGFMINTGSRDEYEEENGLAHLIEHCLFKGTTKRKAFHILSGLDSVGGEINAYTTKEETAIYASCLKEHFARAGELLVDITFSSSFPDKEVEKEKSVIIDEINSYRDTPDEMLMDEFEEKLFPKHPLGRSILGSEKRLLRFSREDILRFVHRNYKTDEIVFVCVGNLSLRRLETFCKKHLESIQFTPREANGREVPDSVSYDLTKKLPVHQVHAMVGGQTIGFDDDRRRAMVLLNNVLGGPALNSRLNLNIREKFGFCYHIESMYTPYSDCGVFQIYFATDQKHHQRVAKLVQNELQRLMDEPLSPRSLSSAKKQLLGQIALSHEQRVSLMLSLGKSVLQFDRVDPYSVIDEQVNSISAQEVQELASETFDSVNLSSLSYVPRKRG